MKITAYHTPLMKVGDDLAATLIAAFPKQLPERSIVVVASKVFSTCEGRFVPKTRGNREEKHALVAKEAEWYLDPHSSKYDLMLTIHRNWMFVNAGIDESNADNQYVLWPADPQASLNALWEKLRTHFGVKELGVTMSDSTSLPLNWGVIGHAIASCGFWPLKSYIGKQDLFAREMKMEQVNIAQSVTTAAVYTMGEGAEQTPAAIVEDVGDVIFHDHVPTPAELKQLHIELEDDAYAPLLTAAPWQRGGSALANQ